MPTIADVPNLSALLGPGQLEQLVAGPPTQGEHLLKVILRQRETVWKDWCAAFDRAIGLVVPLLITAPDGRDRRIRLAQKLSTGDMFWPTVVSVIADVDGTSINLSDGFPVSASGAS